MSNIIRGTTPTLTFKIPFTVDEIDVLYITFGNSNKIILEKSINDDNVDMQDGIITTVLTQEETLLFKNAQAEKYEMQIRARLKDGNAVASKIYNVYIDRILKDGVI